MVERGRLEELLNRLPEVGIAVLGDFAVDGYWEADMVRSELSRETPFHTKPVLSERYSLGAAGNVAANLRSIGCGTVRAVTLIGEDWRGSTMLDLFRAQGIDAEYVQRAPERNTTAFIKPMLKGFEAVTEDARFDFENKARPSADLEKELLDSLSRAIAESNAVILCDQVNMGLFSDTLIKACSELARENPTVFFFADSRYRIAEFRHMILKPNEIEACGAAGIDFRDGQSIQEAGKALSAEDKPLFITAGSDGVYGFGDEEFHQPGFPREEPLDIVGAGDTFLSALAGIMAAGGTPGEAAFCACLASSITVKKLNITGTASPEEMLTRFDEIKT
ncbi:bifunctional heptose 7-phosphate kinase/heptose 1-phosphate adenyltransferase [Planctomycetota bacterium]